MMGQRLKKHGEHNCVKCIHTDVMWAEINKMFIEVPDLLKLISESISVGRSLSLNNYVTKKCTKAN